MPKSNARLYSVPYLLTLQCQGRGASAEVVVLVVMVVAVVGVGQWGVGGDEKLGDADRTRTT
jgi:hypothetical protein